MFMPQHNSLHPRQSGGLHSAGRNAGGDENGTRFIIGFSVAIPLAVLVCLSCWWYQRHRRGLQFIPRRWHKSRRGEKHRTKKTGKKSMAQVKKERAAAAAEEAEERGEVVNGAQEEEKEDERRRDEGLENRVQEKQQPVKPLSPEDGSRLG